MARLNGRGYLILVGGLGVERLAELAWSARNRRRSGPGRRAAPSTFPLMVAVNVGLFAVCAARARGRPAPPPAVGGAARVGLGGAVALRLWCIRSLGEAWNVQASVPQRLRPVTSGPYRFVRHPNYVAVALEFACLPVAGGAYTEALWLSATNALVLVPRIRAEEALLDAVPGYREAFAGVPRFLPRLR